MQKLHLTTRSKRKITDHHSLFIYTETTFIKEVATTSHTAVFLEKTTAELSFVYGDHQVKIPLDQISNHSKHLIDITEDLSVELQLVPKASSLDQTNLILGLVSGLIAIALSAFHTSYWDDLLFLAGSTIIVLLLFMMLYKQPIHNKHYNIRMLSTIMALVLIFFLIPLENWTIKTLIGLFTLTVITRFIKAYQRNLTLIYNPFVKP